MTRGVLRRLVNTTRGQNNKNYARVSLFNFPPEFFCSGFTELDTVKTLCNGNAETKVTMKTELGDMVTFYKALFPPKYKESVEDNEYLKSEPWWHEGEQDTDTDQSSISSESDEEVQELRDSSKETTDLFFGYTAAIHEQLQSTTETRIHNDLAVLGTLNTWVILLCHGGYFAGVVFDGGKLVAHKTVHRYITRRKAGQRQSTRDRTGKKAKSAGANIRRWNEAKHEEEIRDLLTIEWREQLDSADVIFLHAPGRNKNLFLWSGSPLKRNDPRLRGVPFSTRRPSHAEAKKVFLELTTLEIFLNINTALE